MTSKQASTPVPPDIVQLSGIFQLLADSTRLQIVLHILEHQESDVTTLYQTLGLPQPTISHHLGLLRQRGLVTTRRQGKHIYYSVPHQKIDSRTQSCELCIELAGHGIHLYAAPQD